MNINNATKLRSWLAISVTIALTAAAVVVAFIRLEGRVNKNTEWIGRHYEIRRAVDRNCDWIEDHKSLVGVLPAWEERLKNIEGTLEKIWQELASRREADYGYAQD